MGSGWFPSLSTGSPTPEIRSTRDQVPGADAFFHLKVSPFRAVKVHVSPTLCPVVAPHATETL